MIDGERITTVELPGFVTIDFEVSIPEACMEPLITEPSLPSLLCTIQIAKMNGL